MEQYSCGDSFWNILLKSTLGGEGEGGVGRYLGYLVILVLIYLARGFFSVVYLYLIARLYCFIFAKMYFQNCWFYKRYYPLTLENTLAHFWLLLLQLFLFLYLFLLLKIVFFYGCKFLCWKKSWLDLTWCQIQHIYSAIQLLNLASHLVFFPS